MKSTSAGVALLLLVLNHSSGRFDSKSRIKDQCKVKVTMMVKSEKQLNQPKT